MGGTNDGRARAASTWVASGVGPASALACLLALGVGCEQPCADGDCGDDDDTGDPWGGDYEWGSDAFWTHSTPLDELLDLDTAPGQFHWELRMFLSEDDWASNDDWITIAHSVSSLDLLVLDDGVVLLGGVSMAELEGLEDYQWGYIYALSSQDLVHWGTHMWPVHDTETPRLTDVALEQLPDGQIRAAYYATPMDAEGDPAWIPGDHRIKVAYRDGLDFYEEPEAVYVDEGLVDPTLCEFDGEYHFFSTWVTDLAHAVGDDEFAYQTDADFGWVGNQVPYCLEYDDELWVVAQGGGGNPPPAYSILLDDGSFTAPELLYPEPDAIERGNCTSPVMGRYDGQFVLFCATWVEGEGP